MCTIALLPFIVATYEYAVVCSCRLPYEEYCKAMHDLPQAIMEMLGLGLGLDRWVLREFYKAHDSILRLNCYPQCPQPDLTLGTGAHCDPTSLTILHQDEISGLQVFVDNKWRSISPNPKALVINIGDTLMVYSSSFIASISFSNFF